MSDRNGEAHLLVARHAAVWEFDEVAMDWALRYTSHLGYLPPTFRMQFGDSLGTSDVKAHIQYAAELGMAGVLYPWAIDRPEPEVADVRASLVRTGLACSTIVCMPFSLLATGIWSDSSPESREQLAREIARSAKLAKSLGSEVLAAIIVSDANQEKEQQWEHIVASFRAMASIASDHGLALAVEPMTAFPNGMLTSIRESVEFVREVDHPAARIIYDTAHVASMGEGLISAFDEAYDYISLIQFADLPGRVEPGGGELSIVPVAVEAVRRGYSGLVDLEHGWIEEGVEGERAGLERLRTFDAAVKQAAGDR